MSDEYGSGASHANDSDSGRTVSGIGRDHIYVGTIPGLRRWSTDYEQIAEWAGGEENVSIMHKRGREYVLDLSSNAEVVENQEACVNQRYDCGHVAYGPPKRLPLACPECRPVATDGGSIARSEVFRCTACDDFELEKKYSGVAGTPGEEEYDRIEAPDECPVCGGDVEREVVE